MMKSSELVLIVDSVEEAVKFYTEKMAFDLVDAHVGRAGESALASAHLRKGKCFITFRMPQIEELAEFSFIKRCASRCIGLQIEMKKGLDKYFQRCEKKGLKVLGQPKDIPAEGYRAFSLRDPFGIKLTFVQPLTGSRVPQLDFCGMVLKRDDVLSKGRNQNDLIDSMVVHMKQFGILRRAAKKFAKISLKKAANSVK